jgi:hypothetical protein
LILQETAGEGPDFLRFEIPVQRDLCDWVTGDRRWGDAVAKPRDDCCGRRWNFDHRLGPSDEIHWAFSSAPCEGLRARFGSVDPAGRGAVHPEVKHLHNLSDEVLCARWLDSPYYILRRAELLPS